MSSKLFCVPGSAAQVNRKSKGRSKLLQSFVTLWTESYTEWLLSWCWQHLQHFSRHYDHNNNEIQYTLSALSKPHSRLAIFRHISKGDLKMRHSFRVYWTMIEFSWLFSQWTARFICKISKRALHYKMLTCLSEVQSEIHYFLHLTVKRALRPWMWINTSYLCICAHYSFSVA